MTLQNYIDGTYGQLKTQLAWSDSTNIATIITKTLQLYGVDAEEDATDEVKLEALADYAVWRQALADISLDVDFSADNRSVKRSQATESARKNLLAAENVALIYLPNYAMTIHEDDANADWWDS